MNNIFKLNYKYFITSIFNSEIKVPPFSSGLKYVVLFLLSATPENSKGEFISFSIFFPFILYLQR